MSEPLFYLQDSRSTLGSKAVFWAKDGCGYTTDLKKSHVYTLEQATAKHHCRNSDIPLLKSEVDKHLIVAVDHQYIRDEVHFIIDSNDQYIIQKLNCFDGNDIAFVLKGAGVSYCLTDAAVFSLKEAKEKYGYKKGEYKIHSLEYICNLARNVFEVDKINLHFMVRKPGIRIIRKRKPRPTTGKTRMNCPGCGHIFWEYNPYYEGKCDDCK